MSFLGKMFSNLVHSIFGGQDNGAHPAPFFASPPALPSSTMPTSTSDNNMVSHNGTDPVQAAKSDAVFQAFMSAVTASMNGKDAVNLNGNASSGQTISFGYMHNVTQTNPDGTVFTYQQMDPFAQMVETSNFHTLQDTTGAISFGGDTSFTGFYNPGKVIPGQTVHVVSDDYSSSHNDLTLVGLGQPLTDIFPVKG